MSCEKKSASSAYPLEGLSRWFTSRLAKRRNEEKKWMKDDEINYLWTRGSHNHAMRC